MSTSAVETVTDATPLSRSGKDEMNFAEFPIALLTDRVPKGQKSIKFEDQIFDPKKKRMITRRRIIDGSEEYGLPTATDDAVILALIQLTKLRSDFTRRDLEFTRLELLNLLGWPNEGKNYDRIKLSLLRIANVTYNYENAWYDNRQKTWCTKAFHILETVEINDSRSSRNQKCLFPSRIVWNEVVFDSFQASFLRDIDFQLCIRLEHPTALRMYRFLGKRFHVRPEWVFDLKEFAYDHLGLGRNYEGGTQISRKLRPAIAELEKLGFLEPLSEAERFQKKGREWSVRFVQKTGGEVAPLASLPAGTSDEPSPLIAQLIVCGVTKKTAKELVGGFAAELIESKLEVFDWLKRQKDNGLAKNPAGFLVSSIRDGYAPPLGFVSAAEQDRRQAAKLAQQQEEAEARRRKHQDEAQERAMSARITAYRKSLDPEQLAQLEAEAIAQASEAMRRNLDDPAMRLFRDTLVLRITNEHIARVLEPA